MRLVNLISVLVCIIIACISTNEFTSAMSYSAAAVNALVFLAWKD